MHWYFARLFMPRPQVSPGYREVHLNPGQGNIDFAALFQRLELSGYQHHYMMAFGSLADKLVGRDYFAACWPKA